MDETQLKEIEERLQTLNRDNGSWEFQQFSPFGGSKFILNTKNEKVVMESIRKLSVENIVIFAFTPFTILYEREGRCLR